MEIKTLDPKSKYDRKDFVKAMGTKGDLEDYNDALAKDIHDPSARNDLGYLLQKDPSFYSGLPGDIVKKDLNAGLTGVTRAIAGEAIETPKGLERIVGYVENNFNEFLDKLETDKLAVYLRSIRMPLTGNKKIDEVIKAVREVQQVSQMTEEKMGEYVQKKIEKLPDWQQEAFAYGSGNPDYVRRTFQGFARKAFKKFDSLIRDEDGDLDRNKIEKVIRESFKKLYEEYDKTEHPGDKKDVYNIAIRPSYLALADMAYGTEKPAQKWKDNKEREQNKKELKALGVL